MEEISKDDIVRMMDLITKMNGSITLSYLNISDLDSPKKCYNLYYGGFSKIEIYPDMYRDGRCNLSTFNELGGVECVVDRVYENLKNDVSKLIIPTIEKLGLDETTMKYFDRDPGLYEKFINEIKILKNSNKIDK